jgi:uncharacterized protein (TIGR03067 family)
MGKGKMENQDQKKTPNTFQKAARSAWVLFILAIILIVLSQKVPSVLVPIEIAVLIVTVAGLVCGVAGLLGIRRFGTRRILWPALVGIVLNGILVFIFVTNFIAARRTTLPATSSVSDESPHIGTWDTTTPRGEPMSCTFSPDRFVLTVGTRKPITGKYKIDYSKKPVWFTIQTQVADGSAHPFQMILEFQDKNTMRTLAPAPGTSSRPQDFEGRPDVIVYKRRL